MEGLNNMIKITKLNRWLRGFDVARSEEAVCGSLIYNMQMIHLYSMMLMKINSNL